MRHLQSWSSGKARHGLSTGQILFFGNEPARSVKAVILAGRLGIRTSEESSIKPKQMVESAAGRSDSDSCGLDPILCMQEGQQAQRIGVAGRQGAQADEQAQGFDRP